jgi:IclR family transcriptional regulator, acetate operon repressor
MQRDKTRAAPDDDGDAPDVTPDEDKRSGGILAIKRALNILELLAERDTGLSLSEVARLLEVNKQIASRLLATLEASNYLYKDSTTERIFLSYKLSNMGMRKLMQTRILDQSSSVIRELADETGELVRLAVVDRDTLTWVLAAVGQQRTLHIDPNYALKIHLHSTATGKAWLSTLPFEKASELMLNQGLTKRTVHTLTDLDALKKELKRVKTSGYAISNGESELGVSAVAAPVVVAGLNGEARCVATLSVAAPSDRMRKAEMAAITPLVISATRRLAEMWPKTAEHDEAMVSGAPLRLA